MSRLVGIDYGKKKVGFAISDELKICSNPLETVEVHWVWKYIEELNNKYDIECFVIGYATHKDGQDAESMQYIHPFVKALEKKYPHIKVVFENEMYTSVMAKQSLISMGAKKKQRRNKQLIDTISASLILQSYMQNL